MAATVVAVALGALSAVNIVSDVAQTVVLSGIQGLYYGLNFVFYKQTPHSIEDVLQDTDIVLKITLITDRLKKDNTDPPYLTDIITEINDLILIIQNRIKEYNSQWVRVKALNYDDKVQLLIKKINILDMRFDMYLKICTENTH